MKSNDLYDVIIVGGSYSGLAAGMALGRALRNVLIIDSGEPCNRQTPHSHNFLTQDGNTPSAIGRLAKEQVKRYRTVRFFEDIATTVSQTIDGFGVRTGSGHLFNSRKLVFATGIKDIMPAIPGFAGCWGISVLHCPYCHGYEVRNKPTGILANAGDGFEFAKLISNWTNDLTLFTNGKSGLTPEQAAILKKHDIGVIETEIERIVHRNGRMQQLVFRDGTNVPLRALYSRLPFMQHCDLPRSLGCGFTAEGYIQADHSQQTTVHGVFACGDNSGRMRTVANAVSTGTTTGLMINKELIEEEFH